MQVTVWRNRQFGYDVTAAQFTGNNFLAMNTWTSEALKYDNVEDGKCVLHDHVDDNDFDVQIGDWIYRDEDDRLACGGDDWFRRHFQKVTR